MRQYAVKKLFSYNIRRLIKKIYKKFIFYKKYPMDTRFRKNPDPKVIMAKCTMIEAISNIMLYNAYIIQWIPLKKYLNYIAILSKLVYIELQLSNDIRRL